MSTFFRETRAPAIDHVSLAVVNAGGTGHAVDDILTMNLGAGGVGTACTIRVTAESAGVVTAVSVEDSGAYTTQPSPTTNIAQASSSGSGVGFTADLTFTAERVDIMIVKMLMDALTAGRILGVTIGAGGTGYVLGDEITLADPGDAVIDTFEARFEVTSVAAGVVDGIRMVSCGAYTTVHDVSGAAVATTGGTGTGLTVSLTVEGPYTGAPTSGAEGTGYVVGDVLTVNEGTLHAGASHHQFVVTGETAGAIDTVEPLRVGRYDVQPTNPVAITGGTGTGATLDLTPSSWRHNGSIAENYTDGITRGFSFLVLGANFSGADPVIGAKVLEVSGGNQIGVLAATSYDNGAIFEAQPGTSPASQFTDPDTIGHPRVPSAISGTFTLFLSISGRRAIWTALTSPARESVYQGCFTPFIDSPSTKYPSPLFIGATTDDPSIDINDAYSIGGAPHVTWLRNLAHAANGHAFVRDPLGGWRPLQIDTGVAGWKMWPLGNNWGNIVRAPNIETGSGTHTPPESMAESVLDAGSSNGTNHWFNMASLSSGPAPSPFGAGGDDLYFLAPAIIVRDEVGALEVYGELEGIFYMHGLGLNAGDRFEDADGNIYTCQVEPNSAENRHFYATRESG